MTVTFLSCIIFCGFTPKPIKEPLEKEYKIPIIMYHSTNGRNTGKYTVSPALLEEDFLYIKEKGYTAIFIQDLINFQNKGTILPEKPIIITFDDGYYNNYLNAFPLLKKHKIKIVMSVVGKYIDDNYKAEKLIPLKNHLTYEQIAEMHKSGLVEFQCHTYNMHNSKKRLGMSKKRKEALEEYKTVITEDLTHFQNNFKKNLNINCTAICYPFGEYSKETEGIVKELGFKAGLTCNEGINLITRESNLFYLKRYNRPSGKSSEKFFKKIEAKISA